MSKYLLDKNIRAFIRARHEYLENILCTIATGETTEEKFQWLRENRFSVKSIRGKTAICIDSSPVIYICSKFSDGILSFHAELAQE